METFARRLQETDFARFANQPLRQLSPAESDFIPAGTELNAVFDLSCLATSERRKGADRIRRQVQIPAARIRMFKPRAVGVRTVALSALSQLQSAVWRLPKSMSWGQLKRQAAEERCLRAVAPETSIRTLTTGDPLLGRQDHLPSIGWPTALARFQPVVERASPIVLAVIDTGVDLSHPDLTANSWVNPREVPGNGLDDDFNGYIDDVNGFDFSNWSGECGPKSEDFYFHHGTHVAGLAAARWGNAGGGAGVNGVARIMSLNVFGARKSARVSTLENALRYAVDNGANVINLSIGGREYTSSMRETLRYAVSRGVVIVAAAGNDGVELSWNPATARFVTPAVYGKDIGGMITVTSVDSRTNRLSVFSNFSMFLVELSAPGAFRSGSVSQDGLFSTLPHNGYGNLAGTSMSAPLVSGAAGLAQAWMRVAGHPSSPALIERALVESARPAPGAFVYTRSGGILDLDALATWLQNHAPLP
ncbi:MAG: S8 family serine peptidase [Bdellovibrionaceae bacterium]|nr:S8 family serine peptidase [Pseudobdellovibrionaceae bacterium]